MASSQNDFLKLKLSRNNLSDKSIKNTGDKDFSPPDKLANT